MEQRIMKQSPFPAPWAGLAVILVSMCIFAGCSGGQPTGSISGTVALGGSPLTAGAVVFTNEATGFGVTAELDASGTYRIPSIPTGQYQVAIEPPPPPAPHEMDQRGAPRTEVRRKYQDPHTSGLSATVQRGANTVDFAL
jgi:hypothetical protein